MDPDRLAEYVRKVVDAAPPLTNEQLDRIATILRGGKSPWPINEVEIDERERERQRIAAEAKRALHWEA